MERINAIWLLLGLAGLLSASPSVAQPSAAQPGMAQTQPVPADSVKKADLFAADAPLSFTLAAQMKVVVDDRTMPKADSLATRHPATLSWQDASGELQPLPVALMVRGNFRRNQTNCAFPPLYIDFPKKKAKSTPFAGQNKLKLVTHCQGDEYVVREYLVYKVYNLVTPYSYRARMARVTYVDSLQKRPTEIRWGFLIEDEDNVAKRNGMRETKTTVQTSEIDSLNMATMAVFEFMIGNIDWSVPYRHNVRLMAARGDEAPKIIPYDFDHSVIVDAPYASLPDDEGRTYRGALYPGWLMKRVFARYNELKPAIYGLYESDKRLTRSYVKQATRHLDKFYALINNPAQVKAYFFNGDVGGKLFASFN
ncbi:hypothetical protein FAES_3612 [Fibrella aestuarina BUZ 2]|uniref:Uncharacterized protein n=1 Tax=Fibrella aestuarina BUZ 2 TaxID=1166018 RepID=I0KBW6_9BACT|nr:hypothetical protein [Fibrella aestuarina]CCH01619.1 hypothetical protein FAES_3612 [Fibrella aestuarina BUZ 2]